jgi:Icc-related predicted phosphoesterase
MKFVNSAAFYKADVLIMGGDMTGKAIVPVVHLGNGTFRVSFAGRTHTLDGESALTEIEKLIRVNGFYPFRSSQEEVDALSQDPALRDRKFIQLMRETLERWVAIANERLAGKNVSCYMTPGNDDHLEIDDVLDGGPIVANPEGKLVQLSDGKTSREMISCGWSGPTPFDTPRECSEEDLAGRIEAMARQLHSPETAIFNFHDPPYNSHIDMAPMLDSTLQVQTDGGQVRMVPVGSKSVRAAIEQYQPQLGIHGHIHESRGQVKVNRTVCVNPGSEYGEGILRGAVIDLNGDKLKNVQLVAG